MNYFLNFNKTDLIKQLKKRSRTLRIMKLTCFLLLTILLQISATAYSQATKFDMQLENATIKDIFKTIEAQSEFRFFYSDDLNFINQRKSIAMNNVTVEAILDRVLDQSDLSYRIFENNLIVVSPKGALQQGITITGIVTDSSGDPLPGVSVRIRGTSQGTATDAIGAYSLSVQNENAILEFSYIGFIPQEITVGNRSSIDITLIDDTRQLQEVVVVGYGTQRKETLTGSVASIKAADITTTKSENLVNNMQGKLPGLLYRPNSGEPGDFDMALSIRGYGSPVIVIDGIVRTQNGTAELAQINSEDIESISLLKDASAAIYGMNAANGVIIVTTKKGNEGKVRFSYSGMAGTKSPTAMPKMMNALEYRLMANEMDRNLGVNPRFSEDEIVKFRNNEPGYTDWDWINMYVYNWTPLTNNHTISARGGTDRVSFFTSVGYADDKGMLTTDVQKYNRYTIRSNVTASLSNYLKMNVMMSGRLDERQECDAEFYRIYKMLMISDRGSGPYTLNGSGHLSQILPDSMNPEEFATTEGGYRRGRNNTVNTQMDFNYTAPFLSGLSFNLLGSFDISNRNNSRLNKSGNQYNYITDELVIPAGIASYSNSMNQYNKGYAKFQVNYAYKYEEHSLAVLGAVEISSERFDNLSGNRQYLEVYTYDILSQGTVSTQTNSGSREFRRFAAFIGRLNYDYKGKYLVEGMLRRDGSFRYAPNNRWVLFPSISLGWRVSEENFFKNNISFINNLKLRASYGESGRDQGSAFQYIPAYTIDTSRNYILSDNNYIVGMRPPGMVNDRLSWVTAKFYNAAVDVDILNNKLSTTFEFFQRFNTGLLASRNVEAPNTFGASFPQENINSDMNIGLELSLKWRDKVGAFKYSIGANISYARTKRLHVERGPFTSQWDRWKNSNENRYTGRAGGIYDYDGHFTSLDEIKTYPLIGGASGNSLLMPGSYRMVDTNGDGRISGDDQLFTVWAFGSTGGYISGGSDAPSNAVTDPYGFEARPNPPLQYGFPIDAGFKSWDMNILFTGASLFALNLESNEEWGYGTYPAIHVMYFDRWRPVDPNADRFDPATEWISGTYAPLRGGGYSGANNDRSYTSLWRPNVTYLRLKSVEIGYSLPVSITKRIGIDKARFYLNGYNLATFAKKQIRWYDPERMEGTWQVGLSNPTMKAINMGIDLTF